MMMAKKQNKSTAKKPTRKPATKKPTTTKKVSRKSTTKKVTINKHTIAPRVHIDISKNPIATPNKKAPGAVRYIKTIWNKLVGFWGGGPWGGNVK